MPTSFSYTKTKKYSLRALALICILFIVTAPIGIWLLALSFRKIQITNKDIKITPLGKTMTFKEVDRYGIGYYNDLLPGFYGLNTSPTPQRQITIVLILQNKTGKRLRIPLMDYPKKLQAELEKSLKKKPEKMARKGFFKMRTTFIKKA